MDDESTNEFVQMIDSVVKAKTNSKKKENLKKKNRQKTRKKKKKLPKYNVNEKKTETFGLKCNECCV